MTLYGYMNLAMRAFFEDKEEGAFNIENVVYAPAVEEKVKQTMRLAGYSPKVSYVGILGGDTWEMQGFFGETSDVRHGSFCCFFSKSHFTLSVVENDGSSNSWSSKFSI